MPDLDPVSKNFAKPLCLTRESLALTVTQAVTAHKDWEQARASFDQEWPKNAELF